MRQQQQQREQCWPTSLGLNETFCLRFAPFALATPLIFPATATATAAAPLRGPRGHAPLWHIVAARIAQLNLFGLGSLLGLALISWLGRGILVAAAAVVLVPSVVAVVAFVVGFFSIFIIFFSCFLEFAGIVRASSLVTLCSDPCCLLACYLCCSRDSNSSSRASNSNNCTGN